MNAVLYLLTVLIWGTTWIAIKWELGVTPIPLSIALRFAIAALVLFAILAWKRRLAPPRGEAARLVLAQGLCLFCCNFLCFYNATRWVPSGLVAVVFSMATLLNAFNARLFFKQRIAPQVLVGGAFGLAGVMALSWQQLAGESFSWSSLLGLGLAFAGTLCFSFGNLLSSRLQKQGYTPLQTNAWAMLTGTTVLVVGSLIAGVPLRVDGDPRFWGAMLYLAVPGSVIGFTAYLMLVGRMGAARAAYCTVLFPLVALNVSAIFEGYRWAPSALVGIVLVLVGNVLVFRKPTARLAGATDARRPQRPAAHRG
ncbi:DMT family transporter [Paludibacterium purpuratum]|uniref:Drug/metabolite transporter (DMT)-like permease n=1 Tax=Paludibacterium purpuratum TaxID=1144873 RepID=A0A4R7BCM6_9NEIS|nr:EamA family transporter [Paludibacterium purpuratum]TDR81486.1 drug/metabolite transporter (DMT)-like permease [Paludibacterium purpuratum]